MPRAFDTSGFDVQQWLEYNCRPNWEPETSRLFHNVVVENANYKADAMSSGNGIRTGDESITPEVIVLGDSHGTMWSAAIADVTEELNIPAAFFVIGHGENPFFSIPPELDSSNSSGVLTPDQRLMFDTVRLRALTNWKPRLVVITARWNKEHQDLSGDLLTFLKTRNTEVLLIEDPPVLSTNGENAMQFLAWKGLLPEQPVEGQPWHVPCQVLKKNEGGRAIVRQLAGQYDNVRLLPTYDLYTSGERGKVLDGRTPLYLDDDHLTSQGSMLAKPRMRDALLRYFPRQQ